MNPNHYIESISQRLQQQPHAAHPWALGARPKIADRAASKFWQIFIHQLIQSQQFYRDTHPYRSINLSAFNDCLIQVQGQGRQQVSKLVEAMPEAPYRIITKGNNMTEMVTQVELTVDYRRLIKFTVPEIIYIEAYREYESEILQNQYHMIKIDRAGLTAYLEHQQNYYNSLPMNRRQYDTTDYTIAQCQTLLKIAEHDNGSIPHIYRDSPFGRRYYLGPNLQNSGRHLRQAALGDCWQYDLETSVFAWKNHQYHEITGKNLPDTLEYLDHKQPIRKRLAQHCYGRDTHAYQDYIKQAITAIGFGAQLAMNGHKDKTTGQWINGAIADSLRSRTARQLFIQDTWVQDFYQEQRKANRVIIEHYRSQGAESQWQQLTDLYTEAGSIRPDRVMAYLYQHAETSVMRAIMAAAEDSEILLWVHDGFYTRRPIGNETLLDIRQQLADLGMKIAVSHSPAWSSESQDLELHRAHIQREEQLTRDYVSAHCDVAGSDHTVKRVYRDYGRAAQNDTGCHDGSEYSRDSRILRPYNPWNDK